MYRVLVSTLLLTLIPVAASSEEASVSAGVKMPTFGVGARVGGYGFREVDGGKLSWDDCRMNGTGVFGTVDIGRHFFTELSADFYHATASQAEHAMDRVSFFPMVAVGARMLPGKLISPYVQAGGGPEFTRVQLSGVTDKMVLPTAFLGVGGELNLGDFHFGSNIRTFSMGLPEHLHGNTAAALEPELSSDGHDHEAEDSATRMSDQIGMKQEVAAQLQFTVRYSF